jgi:hypothetical protein
MKQEGFFAVTTLDGEQTLLVAILMFLYCAVSPRDPLAVVEQPVRRIKWSLLARLGRLLDRAWCSDFDVRTGGTQSIIAGNYCITCQSRGRCNICTPVFGLFFAARSSDLPNAGYSWPIRKSVKRRPAAWSNIYRVETIPARIVREILTTRPESAVPPCFCTVQRGPGGVFNGSLPKTTTSKDSNTASYCRALAFRMPRAPSAT